MTRKDYIAIAAIFSQQVAQDAGKRGHTITQQLAERMADMMASDNSRFDRARFLKACGVRP